MMNLDRQLEIQHEALRNERDLFIATLEKNPRYSSLSRAYRDSFSSYLRNPGKQFRSLFFILSCSSFLPGENGSFPYYSAALAIDMMHDFILIHDDLVDGAHRRRGEPTVDSKIYELQAGKKEQARHGALILGDLLYSLSLHLFTSGVRSSARGIDAVSRICEAAVETARGQLREFTLQECTWKDVEEESIYEVYDLKTGYYSFAAPMAVGALLGGAEEQVVSSLEEAGLYLSRAFQIRDDYLDIVSSCKVAGKRPHGDIVRGVKTIPLLYLYNNVSGTDRPFIHQILEEKKLCEGTVDRFLCIVEDSKLREYVHECEEIYLQHAFALFTSHIPECLEKKQLFHLCETLFTRE
ncbi:polyprenyl synthetase family protein [Chitinivibrio alkaliphilus]|uniref:Polyprenyl synthetase n=1 Tax=Chitinivibrio alkaliphilus ACht1 TaxID=1313304 RepID=U7DC12_9BACT|nr:polyprenyl synthetase family protein [Chitinivibrio alkaliphilus]ERP31950.1 polyprenyl synthetase [Chitinivibrio alkaliphilus ACht1]